MMIALSLGEIVGGRQSWVGGELGGQFLEEEQNRWRSYEKTVKALSTTPLFCVTFILLQAADDATASTITS